MKQMVNLTDLFPLLSTDNRSQAKPFLVWQLTAKLQIESSEELVDLCEVFFFCSAFLITRYQILLYP